VVVGWAVCRQLCVGARRVCMRARGCAWAVVCRRALARRSAGGWRVRWKLQAGLQALEESTG
jgi:hypothetical protein